MTLADANNSQNAASDPKLSVWVTANAGSGKTRVLTARVARLLLRGVEPQSILCLTYTKAAATEMQNRLFQLLGEWSMKDETALRAELVALGEFADRIDTAEARRLFARAIETPGGLRIQTIHSFCGMLLRRFPMEAGVSPAFRELDDRSSALLREEVLEDMASHLCPDLVAQFLTECAAGDLADLTGTIVGNAAGFQTFSQEDLSERCGNRPGDSFQRLMADVFLGGEEALLARVAAALVGSESSNDTKLANQLGDLPPLQSEAGLVELEDIFVFGEAAAKNGQPKTDRVPTSKGKPLIGADAQPLADFMARIAEHRNRRRGLTALRQTAALHQFATAFLREYQRRKSALGALDFDDLIQKASALLGTKGNASWVLFRLDGRIEHVLVDEAQDTSPRQWEVIRALTAEFTAGETRGPMDRTLFVVGDMKQSIYSFQGADLRVFEGMRDQVLHDFSQVSGIAQPELLHSFRSSPAILDVVDATFSDQFPTALGQVPVTHYAYWDQIPGRVDLLPLIDGEDTDDAQANLSDPVDHVGADHHTNLLAKEIALRLKNLLADKTLIEDKGKIRPMTEGDILILVQRRASIFHRVIAACKANGLEIAGADRLNLSSELAVKDVSALLAFLVTPEDDLSLAAALRSPLLGWDEAQIFNLAHDRRGFLWEALRAGHDRWPETMAILNDLRKEADFLRPFELIERILGHHNGRRRLIAQLGPECEDGIDEFLHQALAYESTESPTLTGFLVWIQSSNVEVKRQIATAGKGIRVMTVHGAKGLEAPVVILAETTDQKPPKPRKIGISHGAQGQDPMSIWLTRELSDELSDIRQDAKDRNILERLRLLYVAMTRAKSWLIIAGSGKRAKTDKSKPEWCWYRLVEAAMQALPTIALPQGGKRYQFGEWPQKGDAVLAEKARDVIQTPEWALTPPDAVVPGEREYSPSNLGGAKALAGEVTTGWTEEDATNKGTALHLLLEHLPQYDPPLWPRIAAHLISEAPLLDQVLSLAQDLLTDPDLAWVFSATSLSETPLVSDLHGKRFFGKIDRLIVTPERVIAIDYKSNQSPPSKATDTPEGLLRQMGAYQAMLETLYPDRPVEVAILWTANRRLMALDRDIVRSAFDRATIP